MGLSLTAVIVVVLVVILGGGIGSIVIYQSAQQPRIQATSIDMSQSTSNPGTAYPIPPGPVRNSGFFNYTTIQPGNYTIGFDNPTSFSKSVSVTYTVAGSIDTKSFVVQPGNSETLSFNLTMNQRLSGTFTVSGGPGNDIDFYIKAQICEEIINFYFTLVNSGSANGNAAVEFQSDGKELWHDVFSVAQGQNVRESGSVVLLDCGGHINNIVIVGTWKA